MAELTTIKNNLVFGLDIGTRSIVGVVGYLEHNIFNVVAMAQKEHDTRSMIDGQIHDIYKVGDTIRKVKVSLENQLDFSLTSERLSLEQSNKLIPIVIVLTSRFSCSTILLVSFTSKILIISILASMPYSLYSMHHIKYFFSLAFN